MKMKIFTCKKCGGHEIDEITDGLWERITWGYNEKTKRYEEIHSKTDGDGSHYFECSNCCECVEDKIVEKLL